MKRARVHSRRRRNDYRGALGTRMVRLYLHKLVPRPWRIYLDADRTPEKYQKSKMVNEILLHFQIARLMRFGGY